MAKELPYFKFEPSAWDTGKIQIVDFELQGIFINLCSFFWQRLGYLPYKLALQKICKGNAAALQKLSDEEIIEIQGDNISIKFLEEQLSEFENISNRNRENALIRWNKKNKRPHNERNTIREDKIKEEKIKNNNIFNFKKSLLDLGVEKEILEDWLKVRKTKKATNTKTAFEKIKKQIELSGKSANECIKICVEKDWRGFEAKWLKNNKQTIDIFNEEEVNKILEDGCKQ